MSKSLPFAFRHLFLLLALSPLWWLLGLDFIIYPAVVIGGLLFMQPTKLDVFESSLTALCLSFFLGLSIAAFTGAPISRIIAAAYNISIIVMELFAYQRFRIYLSQRYLANPDADIKLFTKACTWLLLFSFALTLVAMAIHKTTGSLTISFPTVLGLIIKSSEGIISRSREAFLLSYDWYGADAAGQRYYLMAPYASASAICYVIFGSFALIALRNAATYKRLAIFFIMVFLLWFAVTRSTLYSFLFGTIISTFFFSSTQKKTLFLVLTIAVSFLFLTIFGETIQNIANYRASSNELRMQSYILGFREVMDKNPFFGLGIKPVEAQLHGIPTGSHSTPISSMTKGGLIALVISLCTYFIFPAAYWAKTLLLFRRFRHMPTRLKEEAYHLLRLQCTFWLWILFEDIDAPTFAAFCIFLSYAYIAVFHQRCVLAAKELIQKSPPKETPA